MCAGKDVDYKNVDVIKKTFLLSIYSKSTPDAIAVISEPNDLIIKNNDTFFAAASSSFLLCFLDISTINASPMTLQNAVANEFKRI